MSEKNQKGVKSNFFYVIETKEYPGEIIKNLKEKKIPFKAIKYKEFPEEFEDSYEDLPLIEIEQEIYEKLNKLSEITGIPVKDIASKELGDFFNSVGDYPETFLDRHLGIENIEDPIGMLHKMKDIINIPDKYLKSLKTKEDLIKEVENWYKPFKRLK